MIHRERDSVPVPLVLRKEDRVTELLELARMFLNSKEHVDRQRPFSFDNRMIRDPTVVENLSALFKGLCAFCSRRLHSIDAVTHRLRPPQGAVSADGGVDREHYYWLAYDWRNLYPACTDCSAAQGAKFPVNDSRAPVGVTSVALQAESALLLDPCLDDPEQHLIYLDSGEVVSVTAQGQETIGIFALNRTDLIRDRQEAACAAKDSLQKILRAYKRQEFGVCAEMLEDAYTHDRPLAAVHRQFVNQGVQVRWRQLADVLRLNNVELTDLSGNLQRITRSAQENASDTFFGPRGATIVPIRDTKSKATLSHFEIITAEMRRLRIMEEVGTKSYAIRRIRITNFKGLREVNMDLNGRPGGGDWTMLLGENGVGKTSILQAIALVLSGEHGVKSTGLKPREIIHHGATHGEIRVELEGLNSELGVVFGSDGSFDFHSQSSVPLAAYGATRLLWQKGATEPKFTTSSIENLFNPFVSLSKTSTWVPDLTDSEFEAIASGLRRILNISEDSWIDRSKTGELVLHENLGPTSFLRLSSGYQAMAALALDLMRVFLQSWGTSEAAEGIVLVDEIDAHLHPRWQMRVVESLRAAFPRVQFIATSHSPLTLRGLHNGEALVIRNKEDFVIANRDLPSIAGLTVDQLLTSETFGLHSTIDPAVEKDFSRYYQLLAQRDHDAVTGAEINNLQERLNVRRLMGDTRRERMMLQAIDQYLANESAPGGVERMEVPDQLRARLAEMWKMEIQ